MQVSCTLYSGGISLMCRGGWLGPGLLRLWVLCPGLLRLWVLCPGLLRLWSWALAAVVLGLLRLWSWALAAVVLGSCGWGPAARGLVSCALVAV